jgi:hypothetical protein
MASRCSCDQAIGRQPVLRPADGQGVLRLTRPGQHQLHPLNLGPAHLPRHLQLVLDQALWISLEELGQQDEIDPLLNLLTLPVLLEPELQLSSQKILERRPDLAESVFPILMQRHPHFTLEQLMVVVKIPTHELRHSRAAQELIEEGRQEETANLALRQLTRRCGPLSEVTTARIQALPLEPAGCSGLSSMQEADLAHARGFWEAWEVRLVVRWNDCICH